MKIKSLLFAAIAGTAALALASCQKPETPVNPGKGLLNFSVSVPGSGINYSAKKTGPYAPEDTVLIQIPSAVDNPVKIDNLECFASLDNNCHADPAVPPTLDFTNPYTINVVLADGSTQKNVIKVELVFPEVKIEQVWQSNANKMKVSWTHDVPVATDGEYVYVLDNVENLGDTIRVISVTDGSYVKGIQLPTTFIAQVFVDEGGVLCCSRYNIYGAGFIFYTYDKAEGKWDEPVIYYVPSETLQVPQNLGMRATLVGNVKSGTAYVIATAPNSKEYYSWKFTNGVPQAAPTITTYGAATENWYYAVVRMAKAEVGADIYVAGNNYVPYPNEENSYTYIHKKKSTGDIVQMKQSPNNIGYRVYNFKTFKVGNNEMMAISCQMGCHRYDGSQTKFFNITDENNWKLEPGDAGYNIDFCTFYSGIYGGTNYNMSGGIDVYNVNENEAYIFVSNASRSAPVTPDDYINCNVTCYKATLRK